MRRRKFYLTIMASIGLAMLIGMGGCGPVFVGDDGGPEWDGYYGPDYVGVYGGGYDHDYGHGGAFHHDDGGRVAARGHSSMGARGGGEGHGGGGGGGGHR
jgi:hypothetical protein